MNRFENYCNELCNQEYKGDSKLMFANFKHLGNIQRGVKNVR